MPIYHSLLVDVRIKSCPEVVPELLYQVMDGCKLRLRLVDSGKDTIHHPMLCVLNATVHPGPKPLASEYIDITRNVRYAVLRTVQMPRMMENLSVSVSLVP